MSQAGSSLLWQVSTNPLVHAGVLAKAVADPGAGPAAEVLRVEALALVQMMTNFLQLIIAMTASSQVLLDTQNEMSTLVATAHSLVCSMAAVPKQDILPMFHKVGRLFEVMPRRRTLHMIPKPNAKHCAEAAACLHLQAHTLGASSSPVCPLPLHAVARSCARTCRRCWTSSAAAR